MADYSAISTEDATGLLSSIGYELDEIVPLKGGAANSSFLARVTGSSPVVITVLDNHSDESARTLVELTDWLTEHQVPTPGILSGAGHSQVAHLAGKPVIMRPFLHGTQPGVLTDEQGFTVGRTMASYHLEAVPSEIPLPTRRLPDNWESLLGSTPPDEFVRLVARAESDLVHHMGEDRRLIHGDLFPDNMIWSESGELSILDWETAAVDWPGLDLGFTMVGLAADSVPDNGLTDALLSGYRSGGGAPPSPEQLRAAAHYACAVLIYHRFLRHVVRYPDANRATYWRRLLPFLEATAATTVVSEADQARMAVLDRTESD